MNGSRADALRVALTKIEEIAAVLLDVDETTDEVERVLLRLQRIVRNRLADQEMEMWEANGFPAMPRNSY